MTVLHPRKIDIFIDSGCESDYLLIVSKELTRSQYATQQQRGIDRRDFAVPFSLAGACIHPVIEPAVNTRCTLGEKAERCDGTVASSVLFDPTPRGRDTQRGQAEPGCRNTGHAPMILVVWRSVCSHAIQH